MGMSALSCRCGSGVDPMQLREHAWSACAVPILAGPEHVPTAELSTELRMNHPPTNTATDRLSACRSAPTLCRRRRRVRRRAEEGDCFSRPNQLGKIDLGGTRRGERPVCTRVGAARRGQDAAPSCCLAPRRFSLRGVPPTPDCSRTRRTTIRANALIGPRRCARISGNTIVQWIRLSG
jgi:hypothetical protein